jgi:AcrR family transcriptional regulator
MARRAMDSSTESTHDQIQSIALELFSTQGFDGTALQQIADRLGVTKAALYYHFKTKDELLTAIVEPFFADVEAVLASPSFGPGNRNRNRRQRLEDFIDCLITHRRVLGFLSRDIAVLAHKDIGPRGQLIRDRLSAAIAGSELSFDNRVRVNFALSGLQGAIIDNSTATAEGLRGPVVDCINAVLRTISRDRAAKAGATA